MPRPTCDTVIPHPEPSSWSHGAHWGAVVSGRDLAPPSPRLPAAMCVGCQPWKQEAGLGQGAGSAQSPSEGRSGGGAELAPWGVQWPEGQNLSAVRMETKLDRVAVSLLAFASKQEETGKGCQKWLCVKMRDQQNACLMRMPEGERKTPVQKGEAAGVWPGGRGRAQGLGRGQLAPHDREGRHCRGGISLLMPPIF